MALVEQELLGMNREVHVFHGPCQVAELWPVRSLKWESLGQESELWLVQVLFLGTVIRV